MMKSVDITSILILAYLLAFLLFFEKFVAQDDFFIRQKRSKRKEKVFPESDCRSYEANIEATSKVKVIGHRSLFY